MAGYGESVSGDAEDSRASSPVLVLSASEIASFAFCPQFRHGISSDGGLYRMQPAPATLSGERLRIVGSGAASIAYAGLSACDG